MTTVLDAILARTRRDVASRSRQCPLRTLRARPTAPPQDFASALRGGGLSLIAEYKPKSPSRGELRPDAQPEDIARAYEPYASAISVLCDGPYFGGGYPLLARMRAATTTPLLAKDFVVGEYQIFEARAHGADAILLMAAVLPEADLARLLALSRELGMEPLVETHDDAELGIALRVGARIIGVNSRDLRTLAIDLARARERLLRVPADRVRVAESGIESRADVDALRGLADAVLIGSSLMASASPAARIEELGWTCR